MKSELVKTAESVLPSGFIFRQNGASIIPCAIENNSMMYLNRPSHNFRGNQNNITKKFRILPESLQHKSGYNSRY